MNKIARVAAIVACIAGISICPAQSITGTVTAADTSAPIANATVIAIQRTALASQKPSIYKAEANSAGKYTITISPGQYQLCVQGAGSYLDPCQWGGSIILNATGAAAATAPLSLQKGALFIVRAHDAAQLLAQAETLHGAGMRAYVTSSSIKQFVLPLMFDNGRIRDYGAVVPMNLPLTVIAASSVPLTDQTGAALSPLGISFRGKLGENWGQPARFQSIIKRSGALYGHLEFGCACDTMTGVAASETSGLSPVFRIARMLTHGGSTDRRGNSGY